MDEIGFDNAISEVTRGGHFFAMSQTMARYTTEFYEPVVHDYANFGTWTERGATDAGITATTIWTAILAADQRPVMHGARVEALRAFIEKRTAEGGAFRRADMTARVTPLLHRDDPDKDPLVGHIKVTREDWLNVARDVLVSYGVAAVKVLTLGVRLEVSRSSFYGFFKSREHQLNELLDDC